MRDYFSVTQVAAVDRSLELIRVGEFLDDEAPVVEDPLAPLAMGIVDGSTLPLVDLGELPLAAPVDAVAPISDARHDAEGSPSLVEKHPPSEAPPVAAAEAEVAALPATRCDGACPVPRARTLGTALVWATSVAEAATQAEEAGKLVFVIHVSGNFESPEFT
jgi:hypothetical protein